MEQQQIIQILEQFDLQKINKKENFYKLLINKIEIQIVDKIYSQQLDKKSKFIIFQNVQHNQIFYPYLQLTLNQKQKIWYQMLSNNQFQDNNRGAFLQKQYIQEKPGHKLGFLKDSDHINIIFRNENFKYTLKQMLLLIKEKKSTLIKYVFVKRIFINLMQAIDDCLQRKLFFKFSSATILVKNDNNNFNIKVIVPYFVQKNFKQDLIQQNDKQGLEELYQRVYESYLLEKIKKLVDEIFQTFKKNKLDELSTIIDEFKKHIQPYKEIRQIKQRLIGEDPNSVNNLLQKMVQRYSEQDINQTQSIIGMSQLISNQY
ncbi:hypothetical protein ABPG72_007015 [Tetrahymena utriculariae]